MVYHRRASLRPTCHQTACNYTQDRLGYVGQQTQVAKTTNTKHTDAVHLDAPGQRHGQQPVSGTADPGVVKQDKSSRGSADTTKTRSDPYRVRMSSGERPIGTAKGEQPNTKALSPPPPASKGPNVLASGPYHYEFISLFIEICRLYIA